VPKLRDYSTINARLYTRIGTPGGPVRDYADFRDVGG
jgi:hypothetical protein